MSLVDGKKAVKWPRTWWLDHYLVFCIISVLINLEQHRYLLYCHLLQFGIVRVPCNNLRCECRATSQSPQSSPQGHSRPDSFSLPGLCEQTSSWPNTACQQRSGSRFGEGLRGQGRLVRKIKWNCSINGGFSHTVRQMDGLEDKWMEKRMNG